MVARLRKPAASVKICMVGKYMALQDAYLSVTEAIRHGGIANDARVEIARVDSEDIEKEGAEKLLAGAHGVVVPGGYGDRGVEGKIMAIRHCRETKLPFLGLCLGMQCAVIEFARNVCGWSDAHTSEISSTTQHPVLDLMEGQRGVSDKGAHAAAGQLSDAHHAWHQGAQDLRLGPRGRAAPPSL